MNRTDLALEAQEELARQGGDLRGIQTHQFTRRGIVFSLLLLAGCLFL